MQVNSAFTASPPLDRQDSARRQKSSVTFPPIQQATDERRGSSAPAGAAGKREMQRESILALRRDNAWDSSRADSTTAATPAAVVAAGAAADAPAADDGHSFHISPTPPSQLSTHIVPTLPISQIQRSGKTAKERRSRPSSAATSQESMSARGSLSRGGKGRASPRAASSFRDVVAQVEQAELDAGDMLCDGNVRGALQLISKALQKARDSELLSHRSKIGSVTSSTPRLPTDAAKAHAGGSAAADLTASLRSASSVSSSSSAAAGAAASSAHAAAWRAEVTARLAVTYTVAASTAGVRGGVTAESLTVQQGYFQAAMRYLVEAPDEVLFPEWQSAARHGSGSGSNNSMNDNSASRQSPSRPTNGTKKKKSAKTDQGQTFFCLKGDDELSATRSQLLRCAVRNNAAVCLADRSTRGGRARTVYELLKALSGARGVWGGVVLYNLAVAFLAVEHYDDAAEAIARSMELSYYYLHAAERALHDPLSAPSAAAPAIHAIAALQLVRGHHFIATMAAWCDPAGPVEVQHCEMALGCARQYLSSAEAKQHECQRRLAAAQSRARSSTVVSATATAPLLPYVTQDFLVLREGQGAGGTAMRAFTGAMEVDSLVEGLYAIAPPSATSLVADLPPDVRAYARAAHRKDALQFWVKEAQRLGAAPPFLSSLSALVSLPASPLSDTPGGRGAPVESGSARAARAAGKKTTPARSRPASKKARKQQNGASSPTQAQQHQQHALMPQSARALSPPTAAVPLHGNTISASSSNALPALYRPSKPAPYFVTTLPQSTFQRYRSLRASVVTRFESEESAHTTNSMGAAGGGNSDFAAEGELEGQFGRGRRMTALLYGTVSTSVEVEQKAHHPPSLDEDGMSSTAHSARDDETALHSDADSLRIRLAKKKKQKTTEAAPLLAAPVRPSELLRQLDTETESYYSRLVADPLADEHRHAAIRLQSWWRARVARGERARRSAAVLLRCTQEAEALRIQCAFRAWQQRQRLAAGRAAAHDTRCRAEHVSVVQAYVRHRQSLELWGRACVMRYRQLVRQQEMDRRRRTAAVTLQSWWRMCAAQDTVRVVLKAVLRLQALWRGAHVRADLRRQRVHRRLAEEAYYQRHLPLVLCVQRWWRGCQGRVAARAELQAKQQAVAAYLTHTQAAHEDGMRAHLRDARSGMDAVAAMRVALAVLHGAQDRRRLGRLHHYAQIRKRAVHRYVLRRNGDEVKRRLRQERNEKLRVQRRGEEVAVATVRLQRWARLWLPRRRAAGFTRLATAAQSTAATKIQATWRMHLARRQTDAFSRFMAHGRHQYASTIQRAWRGYQARKTKSLQMGEVEASRYSDVSVADTQERHNDAAARRIQRWYRLHHVDDGTSRRENEEERKYLQQADNSQELDIRDSENTPDRVQTQEVAARRIQRCWRAYAAISLENKAALEASGLVAVHTLTPNAVHAYATWIQAFARSCLVRRTRPIKETLQPHPPSVANTSTSPLSGSVRRFQVPQPPSVQRQSTPSSSGLALTSADADGEAATGGEAAVARRAPPALPGFSHGGAVQSPSLTPKTADLAHTSPSCSALPQSLSRLTGSTDKPLYLFFSDSAYEPYGAGRTQRFSSSTESEYSDEGTEEEEEEEEDADEEDVNTAAVLSSSRTGSAQLASRTRNEEREEANHGEEEEGSDEEEEEELMMFHQPPAPAAAPAAAMAFPIPRPPAPQRMMCTVHCRHTPEEIAAATYIQAVWRGFRVRSKIEYYYEEYYEEVDEGDEEGEEYYDDGEEEEEIQEQEQDD